MFSRRDFIGVVPASALAISCAHAAQPNQSQESAASDGPNKPLIASPPVVQNPRPNGFGVSIAVAGLATAWVEYGFTKEDLRFTATASRHGLIQADDQVLHVRVNHADELPTDRPVFYRVVVQPLKYISAYQLKRGETQTTQIHALRLPDPTADQLRVVSINDTHENLPTIKRLHEKIEKLDPDVLIWNGDTCNDFNAPKVTEQILLNPGQDLSLSWASTRPLLFSNGNHDVRGERAREAARSLVGCPESQELPYNQALRFGPLAIVTLDTGEDKPDQHPVFAGTAAYEPYREQQAAWLKQAVTQPQIRSAPFKIVTSHIPLRGLEGQNDGTTLDGYAYYSGFGAKLWVPILEEAGFQAVLSGHTHRDRLDVATDDMPIAQFVGGGPKLEQATLTIIDAKQVDEHAELDIRIVDLNEKLLHQTQWSS
ncbi:metallophosphoesterase [Stieleria sp. TO1_6]|uniref:metallophosphoesterase family protein n=1 Tax=Stieleria tagensis TaxID=2956795 RepID=UPI00209A724F|nr:metallophosphoesterase [Stieleria tagensis]MCO8121246.1 metallophosphoesterase [Stieleria tagensis]